MIQKFILNFRAETVAQALEVAHPAPAAACTVSFHPRKSAIPPSARTVLSYRVRPRRQECHSFESDCVKRERKPVRFDKGLDSLPFYKVQEVVYAKRDDEAYRRRHAKRFAAS